MISHHINYYILTCLHIVDPCNELPTKKLMKSVNEYPKWGHGCSGSVDQDGKPYDKYCNLNNWMITCCQWTGSSCIPSGGKRNIKQELSIRSMRSKMSLKWSDQTSLAFFGKS